MLDNFFSFHGQDQFIITPSIIENYQVTWKELDPEGRGRLPLSSLRTLVTRLHARGNILGTTVAADEMHLQMVVIEAASRPARAGAGAWEQPRLHFAHLLEVLALHVLGPGALPYEEMLERQEMLAHYARLAVASKITALKRSIAAPNAGDADVEACFALRLDRELAEMRARVGADGDEGEAGDVQEGAQDKEGEQRRLAELTGRAALDALELSEVLSPPAPRERAPPEACAPPRIGALVKGKGAGRARRWPWCNRRNRRSPLRLRRPVRAKARASGIYKYIRYRVHVYRLCFGFAVLHPRHHGKSRYWFLTTSGCSETALAWASSVGQGSRKLGAT